jgi:predicted dehydrogenase
MIRAAIYGMGRWGTTLANSVRESQKIRITTGVSREPARHEAFAKEHGAKVVSSYARVLKDPDIDAVILTTPHSLRTKHIMQAAKAGKHVFVEKPFALNRKTAERTIDACRDADITLAVGFNRRYAPAFVEMMRRIEAGEIGEILHVEGQNSGATGYGLKAGFWRATRAEAPGGGMTARGVHALDCMIRIAGHVSEVYASSQKKILPPEVDMDDTTSMFLKFANGATGMLTSLFATGDYSRVAAFGSKGWLEFRDDDELVYRGLQGRAQTIKLPAVDKERAELEAFADCIETGQRFLVSPADLVNGVAVLELVEKSSARGKPLKIV